MQLGVCMCLCGSRACGGGDEAGHPFPAAGITACAFQGDKPAFASNALRCFALFAGSRPFLHRCPHGLWVAMLFVHPALILIPQNSREDSEDLRDRQPDVAHRLHQVTSVSLMERVARPQAFVQSENSLLLPPQMPRSGVLWRLPVRVPGPGLLRRRLDLHCEQTFLPPSESSSLRSNVKPRDDMHPKSPASSQNLELHLPLLQSQGATCHVRSHGQFPISGLRHTISGVMKDGSQEAERLDGTGGQ